MDRYGKTVFTARYYRIMLFTFAIIVGIMFALLIILIKQKIAYEQTKMKQLFRNTCIAIDNTVKSIADHVDIMQINAEAYLEETEKNSPKNMLFRYLSDVKTGYSLDNYPIEFRDRIGNLTGSGEIRNLSKTAADEINMALNLNSLFYSSKKNIADSRWIYYTSDNNFINIYPWVSSSKSMFSPELKTHSFFTSGLPQNNPERKLLWTSVYNDSYGAGLMVTAAKPVYRKNVFTGTVAIDLTLGTLNDYVWNFESDGSLMIIDTAGYILAHKMLNNKDRKIRNINEKETADLFRIKIDKIWDSILSSAKTLMQDSILMTNRYTCCMMKSAPWIILYVPENQNAYVKYLSIREEVIIMFLTLLLALIIILVITNRITFSEFINPSEKLVNHLDNESKNENAVIPVVPHQWKPWFKTISRIFDQNRNLIGMLRQEKKRFMPKYILILHYGSGRSGSTTIGNYCAAALALNSGIKNRTLYIEYPCPAEIQKKFDIEPDKTIFQHPEGYEIWTGFNLGEVPEEVATNILISKILKEFGNIVINADIEKCSNTDLQLISENAKVIVVMSPEDNEKQPELASFIKKIYEFTKIDKTHIVTIADRKHVSGENETKCKDCDFIIPYDPSLQTVSKDHFEMSETVKPVIDEIVSRCEKMESISIFIPSTIDVNKTYDTTHYVENARNYLGTMFGGATCKKADGVWNSQQNGLVDEEVHIVTSYTTSETLQSNLDEVFAYVRNMKTDLKQEKMAIEVNREMIFL